VKLREAAKVFLTVRIREAGILGKMEPTGGAMVYLGDCDLDQAAISKQIAKLRTSTRNTERKPVLKPAPMIQSDHSLAEPVLQTGLHQAKSVQPVRLPTPSPTITPAPAASTPRNKPVENSRDLALGMLELKPIGAACPDDKGVTLACDARGELHLLCEDEGSRGIERLTAAGAWATKHRELLHAVNRSLASEGDDVVLHLLTREPKRVRHLLDSDVRVHMMARVPERCGTGWCFVELN